MRKQIVAQSSSFEAEHDWLDLGRVTQVEITSEDPSHPIESALQPGEGSGWRAAGPGKQVLRLLFDQPLSIKRIQLAINEEQRARTQEFVLRWSQDNGRSYREIVRQQFNFNPPGTSREQEDYKVGLSGVTSLELEIIPDIGGSDVKAALTRFRLG